MTVELVKDLVISETNLNCNWIKKRLFAGNERVVIDYRCAGQANLNQSAGRTRRRGSLIDCSDLVRYLEDTVPPVFATESERR
jgi:hypothetical protein